ncbi:RNA polymerase sigma factor [Mangrovibacterium diazotrophicum]|uniref:RNA polymerase sigma factor n=1 Tax=Mangrovibacterium diazotrophicum TaxID=1261403 RepID=A0A419W4H0_9BACT|nr:RNA polymerase sigma-70 factor [Mangrovibacterium diazotrophicum]RKD90330.1 RNA polymerase sigma-70 factor (ECF subfamily) [Mangrovibacterium diazotrophicum]
MKHLELGTDKELVIALSNSSTDAFKYLFDRYSQKLYHFVLSYLKSPSESEEIIQEVFIKIWENRGKLDSEKSFKSYLFTIAFNGIKRHFNKKMQEEKYKHDLIEWISDDRPDVEVKVEFEKLIEKLDRLIADFPEKRRVIFIQRKKEGKSINEIAELLAISPKTVKNHITEGMNSLRKSFEEEDLSALLFYVLFIS